MELPVSTYKVIPATMQTELLNAYSTTVLLVLIHAVLLVQMHREVPVPAHPELMFLTFTVLLVEINFLF